MADYLTVTGEHDGTVGNGHLRSALTGLDVSKSSPISPGGSEAATTLTTEEDDDGEVTHVFTISVAGHEGDFTKKSTTAVVDALKNISGVDAESITVDGGYDEPEDSE